MRIIFSPAKKMRVDSDSLASVSTPVFLSKAAEILRWMRTLSYAEVKKLWCCNDKIAEENYARLQEMDLDSNASRTPAILSYDGIAFQYMAPAVFEDGQFDYVQGHLRILSGFYGVLKPMDGVTPYRLEMQAKAKVAGTENLYEYWGDVLYREVCDDPEGQASRLKNGRGDRRLTVPRCLMPFSTHLTALQNGSKNVSRFNEKQYKK